jgi:hypothetical protein
VYDPLETDLSQQWLDNLLRECKKERISGDIALLGGWAVYLLVGKEFRRATGKEYLKSRDIDIFVDSKAEKEFLKAITGLGFVPSAYKFRYEVVYSREKKRIVPVSESKKHPVYDLVYVFLDVFSQNKTGTLGSWVFPELENAERMIVDGTPVVDATHLLGLKIVSFFERDKTHKQYKDACDAYALLFYAGLDKTKLGEESIRLVEYLAKRQEYCTFIAGHLFGDELKSGLVKRNLESLL